MALFRDLLIGVTEFFPRIQEAFVRNWRQVNHLKVYFNINLPALSCGCGCVGCSTGEESLLFAILLQEKLESLSRTTIFEWH